METSTLIFDVNETLSDLHGLGPRFVEVGAPAGLATTWLAEVLRDGFALSMNGAARPFADIAAANLRRLLRPLLGTASRPADEERLDAAIGHILEGLATVPVHPDVAAGIPLLSGQDRTLVTLTNGSATTTRALLEHAGLARHFAALLSVEEVGLWKPAAAPYLYAAEHCGLPAAALILVAVHPWDIDGAHRAGMLTAWINRAGDAYPSYFAAPDMEAAGLDELARILA